MAALQAALGFRLHTGWTALVAAARLPGKIEILLRRHVELLPADDSIPRFVYHEAAQMEPADSADLVKRAAARAQKTARAALRDIVETLRRMDVALDTAGIPGGSTTVPSNLAQILAAHPLIHAAEGALFHRAVSGACESCGLKIITVRERDVMIRAAEALRVEPARFRRSLDEIRQTIGPPWTADEKTATAAALLALSSRLTPAP